MHASSCPPSLWAATVDGNNNQPPGFLPWPGWGGAFFGPGVFCNRTYCFDSILSVPTQTWEINKKMLLTKYPVIGQYQPNQSLTKLEEVLLSRAAFRKVSTELNLERVLVLHPVDLHNSLSRDFNYPRNNNPNGYWSHFSERLEMSRIWVSFQQRSVSWGCTLSWTRWTINLYLLLQKAEVCHYSDTIQGEEWNYSSFSVTL